MDLEFIDEPPPQAGADDDVLDTSRKRPPPRWLVPVFLCALAAVAVVVATRQDTHRATPAPSTSTTPTPVVSIPRLPVAGILDGTVVEIYSRAHDNEPAQDIVRTGSETPQCKGVRIGSVPPQTTAAHVLAVRLRGYTTIDAARIIDQNAGLCALQVRGRNSRGAVIVLTVTSPTPGARPVPRESRAAETRVGAEWVRYVQLRTPVGWIVTIGTVGPIADLPDRAALTAIARDTRVRW